MMAKAAPSTRPTSPHLGIYSFSMPMAMSIVHRITGAGLYFGMALLAWWLLAAAAGPEAFAWPDWFFGTIVGRLVLFGFTWALLHHSIGGVRHLVWDTGRGYGPKARNLMAAGTLVLSLLLTVLVWIAGYLLR
jgi:succinate dehydrogenase / fumarate reductase cytochrome b subunit